MPSIYDIGLERTVANHQPLTPLTLLERAAKTYPEHLAIVHGRQRFSYREFWQRALRLAGALAGRGIGKGDTVTVMLSNTPPMLEAHFGVPMVKAVLHSLNTRLDAAVIAFQLDHAESKVLIVDREFSAVVKEALTIAKAKPLIIEFDDPNTAPTRPIRRASARRPRLRGLRRRRQSGLCLVDARRRMGCALAELHLRHDGKP